MKKLLLPLLLSLPLLSACMKESTFTMSNYADYVTSYQGKLYDDYGACFTVAENESSSTAWQEEGARLYILCDVLDRNLNIKLKQCLKVNVETPHPFSEMDHEYEDPIEILDNTISGGYLNLGFQYYYDPTSNYAHRFQAYWDTEGNEARLYFFHDGNGESPAHMKEDQLKQKTEVYSLSLAPFRDTGKEYSTLVVTLYELNETTVEKNTYRVNISL